MEIGTKLSEESEIVLVNSVKARDGPYMKRRKNLT